MALNRLPLSSVRRAFALGWVLRSLVVLAATSGCVVPAARYEEARSVIQVEQEAHRRTMDAVRDLGDRLARAEEALRQREAMLEQRAQKVSEVELQSNVALQQRDEASDLVDQLRGELGRVGDHLRAFSDDKKRLADALASAEARLSRVSEREREISENGDIVRDLSLILHERIANGDIELSMLDGRAVMRIPEAELSGETPGPIAAQAVAAIARAMKLHPSAAIEISSGKAAAESESVSATVSATPASRAQAALVAQGVAAERLSVISAGADASGEPGFVEIALGARPPTS